MKALDVTYNRLAKRAGGNIGIMRKKAAVARWNLIHQETLTAAYKKCLQWKPGSENVEGQFSTHHEFTKAAASRGFDKRDRVVSQLKKFGNLFRQANDGKLKLNVTTEQNHELLFQSKLNCLEVGEIMCIYDV